MTYSKALLILFDESAELPTVSRVQFDHSHHPSNLTHIDIHVSITYISDILTNYIKPMKESCLLEVYDKNLIIAEVDLQLFLQNSAFFPNLREKQK